MIAGDALAVDQAPEVGQLVTVNGATWRIEHVDQRAGVYGVVARWDGGHRPADAEADGAELWALITVARPRSV